MPKPFGYLQACSGLACKARTRCSRSVRLQVRRTAPGGACMRRGQDTSYPLRPRLRRQEFCTGLRRGAARARRELQPVAGGARGAAEAGGQGSERAAARHGRRAGLCALAGQGAAEEGQGAHAALRRAGRPGAQRGPCAGFQCPRAGALWRCWGWQTTGWLTRWAFLVEGLLTLCCTPKERRAHGHPADAVASNERQRLAWS